MSPSWSRATTTASTRRTTSAVTGAPSWSLRETRASEPVCAAAGALRCPYHSWTYSLAGRLLKAPHTEDGDIDPADFSLHPVGVEEWAGFVFVNLTPGAAEPFADGVARAAANLGNYDMGSLVTGLTLSYDVAANWKVLAENYNECYHCGPVHPELVRLVPAFGGGGTDLAWEDGIPHREGAWTFTMSGTTNRAPLPGLSEAEKVRHKGELVYPNLMLSCSADHVAAFVLRPVAVDRTRIECSLLFARGRRRGRRLRPLRRRRLLGPGQQAGLGDLRVGAARDVVAGLHARLVRPDGGRQRGHPALAAAEAGTGPADG